MIRLDLPIEAAQVLEPDEAEELGIDQRELLGHLAGVKLAQHFVKGHVSVGRGRINAQRIRKVDALPEKLLHLFVSICRALCKRRGRY